MSWGSQSQSSKPVLSDWQKGPEGGIERAFSEIIGPALFGGGPSFAAEQKAARSSERTTREAAAAGFSASDPVTQARLQEGENARMGLEEQQFLAFLDRVLSPLGQSSSGSGINIGIS